MGAGLGVVFAGSDPLVNELPLRRAFSPRAVLGSFAGSTTGFGDAIGAFDVIDVNP